MSKVVLDVPGESSTPAIIDINDGFAEFQAEQREARNKSGLETETPPEEDAQGSEPDIVAAPPAAKPKQEPLSPEQLREQKRASNERRHAERERELNALRVENERLKAEKAAPAESVPARNKVIHPEDPADPRPKQSDYTDFDEYLDDRSTWNARQVLKAEKAQEAAATVKAQAETAREAFEAKMNAFAESTEGFRGTAEEPGIFETVGNDLENGLQDVSRAIFASDTPGEIIQYLGTHPEAMDRLAALRGNPVASLVEYGKLIATAFPASPPAPPVATIKKQALPKPPAAVSGRGHTPSGEAALDAAAEANDFTAFQKTLRSRERKR